VFILAPWNFFESLMISFFSDQKIQAFDPPLIIEKVNMNIYKLFYFGSGELQLIIENIN